MGKKTKQRILDTLEEKEDETESEADVLNDIERRLRKKQKVNSREVDLLIEGYNAFNIPIPKDIKRISKNKLKENKSWD